MSYVRPAILHGGEACCLKESEMEFYERLRDPWQKQCVEYTSKTEKDPQI